MGNLWSARSWLLRQGAADGYFIFKAYRSNKTSQDACLKSTRTSNRTRITNAHGHSAKGQDRLLPFKDSLRTFHTQLPVGYGFQGDTNPHQSCVNMCKSHSSSNHTTTSTIKLKPPIQKFHEILAPLVPKCHDPQSHR